MRIAALSDQHGYLPEVPPCDLLIVAGDVCPDVFEGITASAMPERQALWFDREVRPWLEAAPATHKILTWGNHDWCGQSRDFSGDAPRRASTTTLQIVVDEGASVPANLAGQSGRSLLVWATPWSNPFMDWAFMKEPAALAEVYASIPAGIDILVSHQPPYGYGDLVPGRTDHLGSRELLAAIDRVRPRLVICGHIHGGHGRYEHDGVPIYNVSVVDERYRLVHPPTIIEWA